LECIHVAVAIVWRGACGVVRWRVDYAILPDCVCDGIVREESAPDRRADQYSPVGALCCLLSGLVFYVSSARTFDPCRSTDLPKGSGQIVLIEVARVIGREIQITVSGGSDLPVHVASAGTSSYTRLGSID